MNRIFLVLVLLSLLTACGPAGVTTPQEPLPTQRANSAPGDWTSLKFTQSGGIMGRSRWVEIQNSGAMTFTDERANTTVNETLTKTDMGELIELISLFTYRPPADPSLVCADCFEYTLEFVSPAGTAVFETNDINLVDSGMDPLISFLLGLMEAAFR